MQTVSQFCHCVTSWVSWKIWFYGWMLVTTKFRQIGNNKTRKKSFIRSSFWSTYLRERGEWVRIENERGWYIYSNFASNSIYAKNKSHFNRQRFDPVNLISTEWEIRSKCREILWFGHVVCRSSNNVSLTQSHSKRQSSASQNATEIHFRLWFLFHNIENSSKRCHIITELFILFSPHKPSSLTKNRIIVDVIHIVARKSQFALFGPIDDRQWRTSKTNQFHFFFIIEFSNVEYFEFRLHTLNGGCVRKMWDVDTPFPSASPDFWMDWFAYEKLLAASQ